MRYIGIWGEMSLRGRAYEKDTRADSSNDEVMVVLETSTSRLAILPVRQIDTASPLWEDERKHLAG